MGYRKRVSDDIRELVKGHPNISTQDIQKEIYQKHSWNPATIYALLMSLKHFEMLEENNGKWKAKQ